MWVILCVCVCVWRVSEACSNQVSICLVCLCVYVRLVRFFGVCVCFAARIGVSCGGGFPFYNHQTNITIQEAF